MRTRILVAGTAVGLGLLLSGEGNLASSETAQAGAAVLILDGIALAAPLCKEDRKRREVARRYASMQWSHLPPFRKDQVLGLHLLQAYADGAAQQLHETRGKPSSNDPCFYVRTLVDRLANETKYVPENIRFNAVVDGIQTELIKNYKATYLIRSSDPERPDLSRVCEQLDHHLPIDPNAVPTVRHATWFDYIRDQAMLPYTDPYNAINTIPQVPSALTEALGRHASEAS